MAVGVEEIGYAGIHELDKDQLLIRLRMAHDMYWYTRSKYANKGSGNSIGLRGEIQTCIRGLSQYLSKYELDDIIEELHFKDKKKEEEMALLHAGGVVKHEGYTGRYQKG